MRFPAVNIIFRKEITEMLRDKRTIFVTFILPILMYPLLILGITQLSVIMIQKVERDTFIVNIENGKNFPQLMTALEADTQFVFAAPAKPESAVVAGDLQLYVQIPEHFDSIIAAGGTDSLKICYTAAKEKSTAAKERFEKIVADIEKKIVLTRLSNAGLDSALANPIASNFSNVAGKKQMGGFIFGGMIAFFVVILVVTGAYYPSVDLIAGEKERGTLETLLVSPAARTEIVAGKFAAVIALALANAMLNLASLYLTFAFGMGMMSGPLGEHIQFSITLSNLLFILVLIFPLAALFGALFLTISSYAKTYKEAQGYLTPVFMAAQFPAMAALLPAFHLNTGMLFIPVLNVTMLFKEMLSGKSELWQIAVVFAVNAFLAILGIRWAARTLSNEEHLLSSEEGSFFAKLFAQKSTRTKIAKREKLPSLADSLFLFALTVALMFWIGQKLQAHEIISGLVATQILLIFLPPLLLARRLGYDLSQTFSLKIPKFLPSIATVFASSGLFILILQLQVLLSSSFTLPPEFTEAFKEMFGKLNSLGLFGGITVIALFPAMCEEFLFRGYILTGISQKHGKVWGIVISALLFGLLHMSPYKLLPTALIGALLAIIVTYRGSIIYGMIGHFTNNALAFLITYFALDSTPWAIGEAFAPAWVIVAAAISLIGGLWGALRFDSNNVPTDTQL